MRKTEKQQFSLSARLRSFANAFSGIGVMLKGEHNFRIHVFVLLVAVICGFIFNLSPAEWILIVIVSGMVLAAECFNTALEYLSDEVSVEFSERIKKVKDIAAAGVLFTAIAAAIAGLIIFVPRVILIFK
jgi:diacylglycerol kinase (ATP)